MIAFCLAFVTADCRLNQAGALGGQGGVEFSEPLGRE